MLFTRIITSPLPHEHVIFYLRRHWVVFAFQTIAYLAALAAPALVLYVTFTWAQGLWDWLMAGGLVTVLLILFLSLYYLATWFFFWNAWVDYYLDVWIVTNERILSLEQFGLFNRKVAELRLSRVQDVSSQVKGILQTFLHFGEVKIQTAGEEANFLFHQIPRPYEVAEKILRLADDWRHSHSNGAP